MLIVSRPWSARTALFCLAVIALAAAPLQAQVKPLTPFERQMARVDLGLTASGQITPSDTGTTNYPQVETVVNKASTTVGFLGTLRYTWKPLIGFEANFSQARFNENFTNLIGGAQTKVNEETLGYVAHGPKLFGIETFGGVGLGTIAFHPTRNGGQGLPFQYRAVYYYSVGLDAPILGPHFGLRLNFREIFYKAPDFIQNYLTIQQHTTTFEPGIGFFLKF
jgi:Outer membrane protein beta-barrel domain